MILTAIQNIFQYLQNLHPCKSDTSLCFIFPTPCIIVQFIQLRPTTHTVVI